MSRGPQHSKGFGFCSDCLWNSGGFWIQVQHDLRKIGGAPSSFPPLTVPNIKPLLVVYSEMDQVELSERPEEPWAPKVVKGLWRDRGRIDLSHSKSHFLETSEFYVALRLVKTRPFISLYIKSILGKGSVCFILISRLLHSVKAFPASLQFPTSLK